MSLLDASQQLTLGALRRQRRPKIQGVRDWILSASYRLEQTPKKRDTSLIVDTSTEVVEALAFDIARYSSAAIETSQHLQSYVDRPMASGWVVIRSYYAAYFAANALMRLFGYFCTNLEQKHVTAIHEMANLYQIPLPTTEKTKLGPGTYAGRYSAADGQVSFRSLHTIGGGAHKQFWFAFKEFLDSFDSEIRACTLSKSQQTAARDSINSLTNALCYQNNPNGSWLSEIRNAVNYRLEYGAWYPYADGIVRTEDLVAAMSNAFVDTPRLKITDLRAHDLARSTDGCAYLLSWMLASITRLADQSSGGSTHFLRTGPLALLI